MLRASDVLVFAGKFAVEAALLGVLFWSLPVRGVYGLRAILLAVPAIAAMTASRGFTRRRKLIYVGTTLLVYGLTVAVAVVTGLNHRATAQWDPTSIPVLPVILYVSFLTVFPLVMLVLFVGRSPSLLWSKTID